MEGKAFVWERIFYIPDLIPLGLGAGNFNLQDQEHKDYNSIRSQITLGSKLL